MRQTHSTGPLPYQRALLACGHRVLFAQPGPGMLYCPYHGVQRVVSTRPASDRGEVPRLTEYAYACRR